MNQRVGVIGGGQLAWMMAKEANKIGIELSVQTPNPSDPAVYLAKRAFFAAIADVEATEKMSRYCEVITFENEFVDLVELQKLADRGVRFAPSLQFLAPLLDKYDQRVCLQQLDIPVPRFTEWQLKESLPKGWHFPVVIKARRHGYDGQGTFVVKDAIALKTLPKSLAKIPLILEEFVPFKKELAIMVVRNIQGEICIYPVVETEQIDQICRWVLAPAAISKTVQEKIEVIAKTVATKLELVGVMGIELFLTADERILVNELAPRTHNSGHYTLNACHTSQFAMQLQAITGMPLSSTKMTHPAAIMVNLLGYENATDNYLNKRQQLGQLPQTYVHWYGKAAARRGRKLGHVTVLSSETDRDALLAIAKNIESIWYPASDSAGVV